MKPWPTCGVDHALGCRCGSSENVGRAAGRGRPAGGGRTHRVDGQAARRRLFHRNHNAPGKDAMRKLLGLGNMHLLLSSTSTGAASFWVVWAHGGL